MAASVVDVIMMLKSFAQPHLAVLHDAELVKPSATLDKLTPSICDSLLRKETAIIKEKMARREKADRNGMFPAGLNCCIIIKINCVLSFVPVSLENVLVLVGCAVACHACDQKSKRTGSGLRPS